MCLHLLGVKNKGKNNCWKRASMCVVVHLSELFFQLWIAAQNPVVCWTRSTCYILEKNSPIEALLHVKGKELMAQTWRIFTLVWSRKYHSMGKNPSFKEDYSSYFQIS